jgi:lipoprotein-anchoring transpeptidase ErfK/SrfK
MGTDGGHVMNNAVQYVGRHRRSTDAMGFAVCAFLAASAAAATAAHAGPLALADTGRDAALFDRLVATRAAPSAPETSDELPLRFKRQVIDYPGSETPGTIVIDTGHTYLYFILGHGQAIRYAIGVGRVGFSWAGTTSVSRKAEWPDWIPPAEMLGRQPYLSRWMAGGSSNPLGARAIYLGSTAYRIHGTNSPSTIGGRVSSGCFRMTNEDVIDLYGRVAMGSKVVVLPDTPQRAPAMALPGRGFPARAPRADHDAVATSGLY